MEIIGYMIVAQVPNTTIIETDSFDIETYKDLPDFIMNRLNNWTEKWHRTMELISIIRLY